MDVFVTKYKTWSWFIGLFEIFLNICLDRATQQSTINSVCFKSQPGRLGFSDFI
jgi:hypothetical protein